MSTALQTQEVAAEPQPEESLLSVIARVANDPRGMNVEVMERLLAMKERIDVSNREASFMAAMSRVQPRIPQINKAGRIEVQGQVRSRFARLEDIDTAIRPIIAEEGFAVSFDTEMVGGSVQIIGRLSHRDGHSETKKLTLPIDSSGSKNGVQAVGSTVSYGRRMLVKMFFNVVETEEDDDGNGGSEKISESQALNIIDLLDSTKSDRARFLRFMGVDKVENILARDLKKALNALNQKARQ